MAISEVLRSKIWESKCNAVNRLLSCYATRAEGESATWSRSDSDEEVCESLKMPIRFANFA